MSKSKGEINLISKDSIGYKDDDFIHLADEIAGIRGAMRMYISRGETDGALHLFKEIFNNALDECNNDNSPANKIDIEFYQSCRKFIVTDNGRGIPTDILYTAVMNKHVSTKLLDKSIRNKKQTGLNGVGLTVTAALTDYMSITTYRNDHSLELELIDGVPTEHDIIKTKTKMHGTKVVLIPSEKYLGKINLTNDIVEDFIRHMSYIIPKDIIINLYVEDENGKMHHTKYIAKSLSDNLNYLSSSIEFTPVEITCITDNFDISVAISYDKNTDDIISESYANYVVTTEGGTHDTCVQRAVCEYFSKEAKKLDPNAKYEVSYDDCRKGLCYIVNVEHVAPEFEGQHKSKLSNNDILSDGKKVVIDAFKDYYSKNPNILRKVVSYLRQISKIRMEANKIKGVATKKASTFIDDAELKGFYNVSDRKYTGYREIYFAEGDSAVSALLACRNPKYQALYGLTGVIDNVYDYTLDKLLQKPLFSNIVKILGCGIGKSFDITKLRFDKIIIGTDSDSDGFNITSLVLLFIFKFLPELITNGKVYKAMAPLYLLDKKTMKKFYNGREWLYDKNEFYNLYNSIIAENTDISLVLPGNKVGETLSTPTALKNKSIRKEWLEQNSEYSLELSNLGKKSTCDEYIVELVCYYKLICKDNDMLFKTLIEKEFPEMDYDLDNKALIGAWDGNRFSLICDNLFMKSAKRFIEILKLNPTVWIMASATKDSELQKYTIGSFYKEMYRLYTLDIESRFKGLGEAESELLFMTTTNPVHRKLLRFNIKDAKKFSELLDLLHGKNANMREKRREMLENASISYADIDN